MRILVVDDNEDTTSMLVASLPLHDVRSANSAREAVALLSTEPFDLVVSDYQMPEINGVELLSWLRAHQPHVGAILLTGHAADLLCKTSTADRRMVVVLLKPVDPADLNNRIDELGTLLNFRKKL